MGIEKGANMNQTDAQKVVDNMHEVGRYNLELY